VASFLYQPRGNTGPAMGWEARYYNASCRCATSKT